MRRRKLYRGSSPLRVVDILDAVGLPLTLAEIEAEYEHRFGRVSVQTLSQACKRLRNEGFLEAVSVENPLNLQIPRLVYRLAGPVDVAASSKFDRPAGKVASLSDGVFWGRVKARQDAYFEGVRP